MSVTSGSAHCDVSMATSQGTDRPKKRIRTIHGLSKQQLQHKRDIDRKAQRALRERTKNHVSTLECQLADVKADAERRERDVKALTEANASLVRCLESIAELASSTARQVREMGTIGVTAGAQDVSEDGTDSQELEASSDRSHAVLPHATDCIDHRNGSHWNQIDDPETQPQLEGFEEQAAPSRTIQSDGSISIPAELTPAISYSAQWPESDMHPSQDVQSLVVTHSISVASPETLLTPAYSAGTNYSTNFSGSSVASTVWSVPCTHAPPGCPLDEIQHDFLASSREAVANGDSLEAIVGHRKFNVKAVFEPNATYLPRLSTVTAQVLGTFAHVDLTERLAFFYLMCHTMRWMICPTQQNYRAMPAWLRPTVTQITVPHAMWIDNIPWPGVRDILIDNPDKYPFELFSDYYSSSVTVNWPYDEHDAVSDDAGSDDAGGKSLHTIFEKHIRDLKNWTVSEEFKGRFPQMLSALSDDA